MAKPRAKLSDEELQRLLLESDDENDIIEFENESDLEETDCLESRPENSDTEQDISDADTEVTEEENEEYYFGKDKTTKWTKEVRRQGKRQRQNVLSEQSGVRPLAKNAKTEIECWNCFITDDILELILFHTNTYIHTIAKRYSRERDAKQLDKTEFKAFLGLLYLAGYHRSNRINLQDLWATDGSGIELFRLTMSLQRFRFIHNCIRFDDKLTRLERLKVDKLAAVRDIFSSFVKNCKSCYSLGENVTIDEMLPGFRGKCGFRQYIPSKPNKYGIKIFAMVDSKLFYTANLEIYAGKQPDGPYFVSNKPVDVIKRLAEPIYNSGRNITADNWFTDINLISDLKQKLLSYVGTVRKNKRQIPPELVTTSNRPIKSNLFAFGADCTLVSHIPKKGKNVILVSSVHFDKSVNLDTCKPEIVEFYNNTKSGVDTVDQMVGTYNVARNTRRWPMVIFYTILNIAGVNAQIIYMKNNAKNDILRRRMFIRKLITELLSEQIKRRSENTTGVHKPLHLKLQQFHKQSEENEETDTTASTSNKRKRCSTCSASKKSRLSKYFCKCCEKYLCLEHSNIICDNCYNRFANQMTEESD